jgi:processive 1,2-diacylglycerol beta-glucosyltransferase
MKQKKLENRAESFHVMLTILGLSCITLLLSILLFFTQRKPVAPATVLRKKIVIFTSDGGGGHRSVTTTLKKHLSSLYDVQEVNIFADLLAPIDPLRFLTFNTYTCEDFYNYLLKNKWTRTTNALCRYGQWATQSRSTAIKKLLKNKLTKLKADMVISVVPLVNGHIYNLAAELNLPFLIVTNDLDTRNYLEGMYKPTYKHFKYTLAFNNKEMRALIEQAGLMQDTIETTGFPLRKDFFEEKDVTQICQDFSLPRDKPKILLIMGATGSHTLYEYTKKLVSMEMPLHVVVCLGHNQGLEKKIQALPKNKGVTLTTIGFTPRISDLMAACDLLITKPGPNTICEAIQMNIPMMLDDTSHHLFWERFNLQFVESESIGIRVKKSSDLKKIIPDLFNNKEKYAALKQNLANMKKNEFEQNIKNLVAIMFNQHVSSSLQTTQESSLSPDQ